MKNIYLSMTALALTFLSISSTAAIYKCKSASGKIEYSDKPCKGQAQSQSKELSKHNTGPIVSLSKSSVSGLLRQVESALKARSIDRIASYFTPDAEFVLDMPKNMGGKTQMRLGEYQKTLQLGWSVPGKHSVRLENIVITLAEDKKSAKVTAVAVESLEMDGNVIMSARAKEKLTVVIHQGKPKISYLYAKLESNSMLDNLKKR